MHLARHVLAAALGVACGPSTGAADGGPPSDACSSTPHTDPNICPATGCDAASAACPATCTPLGVVRFHLQVPASDAGSYSATTYGLGQDPVNWFTVSTPSGQAVPILPPVSGGAPWSASCSVCAVGATEPIQPGVPIEGGSISGTWSGTSYSLTSTCNDPMYGKVPCGDVVCAQAGEYVVTMCAEPPASVTMQTKCVSVMFAFPGTADVTGMLTP